MPTDVSQLQANPEGTITGRNDCWEACLASYLKDHHDTHTPTSALDLMHAIRLDATGIPDQEWQPPTTLPEAEKTLLDYHVGFQWTDSFQAALAAPDSICLVDGTKLAPAQYPQSWFGDPGQANHFIRWLPYQQEADNWFMDPLAPAICQYDLASVQGAFAGAFILIELHDVLNRDCALKPKPTHEYAGLAQLHRTEQVTPLGPVAIAVPGPRGHEDWTKVRTAAGIEGWVPDAYLT